MTPGLHKLLMLSVLLAFVTTSQAVAEPEPIVVAEVGFHSARLPGGESEFCAWGGLSGTLVPDLRRAKLKTPTDSARLRRDEEEAAEMGFERCFESHSELLASFPGGDYILTMRGKGRMGTKAKLVFSLEEPVFADYPEILSPQDEEREVPLTPTITWTEVPDAEYWIQIWDFRTDECVLDEWLEVGTTSFTVPEGVLSETEWYDVEVGADVPGLNSASWMTSFKTGSVK